MLEAPKQEPNGGGQPPQGAVLDRLALSPSVQDAIREIPGLIRAKMDNDTAIARTRLEADAASTRKATRDILLATVFLALVVVLPTSLLAWSGKLSPEAATFLFGAIVGAAFTFLRDFFPRSG